MAFPALAHIEPPPRSPLRIGADRGCQSSQMPTLQRRRLC